VNEPGGDQQSLVSTPSHGAAELSNGAWADTSLVSLALKEHGKTGQAKAIDPESINTAVTAPTSDRCAVKARLPKQAPS
jgi:hypothetical protein